MKIIEIIQRVQASYPEEARFAKVVPSRRRIYSKMVTSRSKLLVQQSNKKQKISSLSYQTLPNILLKEVPIIECPIDVSSPCLILKSTKKLPQLVSNINKEMVKSVSSQDLRLKIDELNINNMKYQKGNKYTSSKANYFIEGGYLYLIGPNSIQGVTLTGIFEDPLQAILFSICDDEPCGEEGDCIDYLEQDFHIDNDSVDTLVMMTLEELLVLFTKGQANKQEAQK